MASSLAALENLPFELLLPIVQALIPAPPPTTRFALRPAGTWELHDADHQYAEWLRAHNDLLAFACTSRQMAAFTKPFLYQTIVVHDVRGLIKLYRRMRRRPDIRPLIRNLACLVNVSGERTIERLHWEWQAQTGVKWLRRHGMYVARHDLIGLAMLEEIVFSSPNLRDLLFAFPDHELQDDGEDYLDWMTQDFTTSIGVYVNSTNYPASLKRVIGTEYLSYLLHVSKLTSLRIYCHREGIEREHTYSRFLADCAVSSLAAFTSLRTLELCCSSFGNFERDPISLPPLPHIEHLRLYGSYLQEPRLTAIILACTQLQTLLVHFEHSTVDEDRDLLPGPGMTLNDALRGVASTLHTLELVALGQGHYITRGRERPRKPENHRLTCIPDLHRLTDLTLDYRGVFGTLGILEEDDGERLCQLLPVGVRHFTLECEWGTSKDWKRSYQADLDVMLYGVGCLCSAESLNLESISLAIHSWPAQSRFHRRFRREMERARLRCAEAGIKFRTFDILPSYLDEDQIEMDEEEHDDDQDDAPGDGEAVPGVAAEDGEGTGEELELEEEDEASEYYMSSGDDEPDPEREAMRPGTFDEFLQRLGDGHGHNLDELFFAYHEDRWDEYLF
ncbi:hypothetical protein B0T18DRAFT_438853 [Schizothecium vesticola]|uniref:F-box domain-containing protein n=1 Tax=Schizothecium vesticola TaxID=314040 RepID=A0AA40ENJ3_9PEZI|nr:hypothetical protein B0T18DRAFT_438853 [Schizothecium vesticola]